jgi:CRP-like cAMP-binding protein
MPSLLLVGALDDTRPLLDLLAESEYAVTMARGVDTIGDWSWQGHSPCVVVASLEEAVQNGRWPRAADAQGIGAWIAWNRCDRPDLALCAYERGALAVLPAQLTREALHGALRTAFARLSRGRSSDRGRAVRGAGRYMRGERILLDEGDVLTVERGVVATTVLHEDGSEVLIGLAGPGDVVIGHPHDACCLELHAHTDVGVVVQPWGHAAATPRFAERLRARLRRTEAWVAMQARPHLEDRVTGLLSLLAEAFGEPHPGGTRVAVRLTHAQLAAALGATRATITRVVGRLRRQRVLETEGRGVDERFILRVVERHAHQ